MDAAASESWPFGTDGHVASCGGGVVPPAFDVPSASKMRSLRRSAAQAVCQGRLAAAFDRIQQLEKELFSLRAGNHLLLRRGKCGPRSKPCRFRADAAVFVPEDHWSDEADRARCDAVLEFLGAFDAGGGGYVVEKDVCVVGQSPEDNPTATHDLVFSAERVSDGECRVPQLCDDILPELLVRDAIPEVMIGGDGGDMHESDFMVGLDCCRWAAVVVDEVSKFNPSQGCVDGVVGHSPEEYPTATTFDRKIGDEGGSIEDVGVGARHARGRAASAPPVRGQQGAVGRGPPTEPEVFSDSELFFANALGTPGADFGFAGASSRVRCAGRSRRQQARSPVKLQNRFLPGSLSSDDLVTACSAVVRFSPGAPCAVVPEVAVEAIKKVPDTIIATTVGDFAAPSASSDGTLWTSIEKAMETCPFGHSMSYCQNVPRKARCSSCHESRIADGLCCSSPECVFVICGPCGVLMMDVEVNPGTGKGGRKGNGKGK